MKIFGIDTDRLTTIIWIFLTLSAEVAPQFNIRKTDEDIFDFITGEMVPYQVQPDEIITTKVELQKEEDKPQEYYYLMEYVPSEDHYLVKKKGANPDDLQFNDHVLLVKKGEKQTMGRTIVTDSNFDEENVLGIVDSLQDEMTKRGLTSIHFGTMNDPKRTLDDFEQALFSHDRILKILRYENDGDGEHFLHFNEDDMELPEFKDMIPLYLEHLNKILVETIFPKIKSLIDVISSGKDSKDFESLSYFQKNFGDSQDDKLKENVLKHIKEFTKLVSQNKFMMSTIKSYYVNDIRNFVNSSNVITSMYESINNKTMNMVVEALRDHVIAAGFDSIPWSLANPNWTEEDDKTMHIQRKIKDLLSKTVSQYLSNEITKDAPKDEHGNLIVRSIQDKIDNPETPIEKHELHLIQIMTHLNEELEPIIDEKFDVTQQQLEPLIDIFLAEADFNAFVMGMLVEKSKDGIHDFIHNYTSKTIERTFVPEVFLGPGVPMVDKQIFSNSMELFNSRFRTQESNVDDNFVSFIYEGPEVLGNEVHHEIDEEDDRSQDQTPEITSVVNDGLDKNGLEKGEESQVSLDSQNNPKKKVNDDIQEDQTVVNDSQEVHDKQKITNSNPTDNTSHSSNVSDQQKIELNQKPNLHDEDEDLQQVKDKEVEDLPENQNPNDKKHQDLAVIDSEVSDDNFSRPSHDNQKVHNKTARNRLLLD